MKSLFIKYVFLFAVLFTGGVSHLMANTLTIDGNHNVFLSNLNTAELFNQPHQFNKFSESNFEIFHSFVADSSEEEENRGIKKTLNSSINFSVFYYTNQSPEILILHKGIFSVDAILANDDTDLCVLFQVFRI